ncbi:stalk domain-containing protein [Paenibacillus sp. GCM10012307]|uniref:Copper amine oxidase N-terminal domain-containing protein n=1 Tax=Paenibacillus roseus TaxID=2798579 RepID=A0A934J660_9BACL|nr:stalk domain-containing protein [Paenibacillus roseus]MBJ6361102.1 copper amine oxidase N-terminal domain-containing protein [Paenibacillus roseus]
MKKMIVLLGLSFLLTIAPSSISANESGSKITIKVNGYTIQMYEAPAYIDGKTSLTYVPLRFVSEALGAEIEYVNSKTPITTTIEKPKHNEVKVMIDSKKVEVNGKVENYPGAAVLQNGRTMVPLRVISEGLGAKVKWTPNKGGGGTVEINTPWETPKPAESVKWSPNEHQKEYAQQVFKLIRFDISNSNLKIKIPSVKGKDVSAGLRINNKEAQALKLDTLYEYKVSKGIKLNITIAGDYQGQNVIFDKYTIYSRDMLPSYVDVSGIAEDGDLIVVDQFQTVVPLKAVLKALDF